MSLGRSSSSGVAESANQFPALNHSLWKIENFDCLVQILQRVLDTAKVAYTVQAGEGAFYGPKIDLKIKDAIGRSWQCGTIQCDFALPERFDLKYAGEDGREHRTIMVHRALLGSAHITAGELIADRLLSPLEVQALQPS